MKRLRSSIVVLVGTIYFLVGGLTTFARVIFLLPTPAPQPNSIYPPSIMTGVGNYGLPILIVGLIGVSIGAFMIITIFRQAK